MKNISRVLKIATELETEGNLQEAHTYLSNVRKELDAMLKAEIAKIEDNAIELEQAERVHSHYQYRAPNKAQYIALHGEAAFNENATCVPYKKLVWS
jgi:hypothetical protein